MKIRSGFVSNSSSSSFMIAIGKVVNEVELVNFLIANKVSNYEIVSYENFEFSKYSGVKRSEYARLNKDETEISVESFNGNYVRAPYDKTQKYFAYYDCQDCDCNDDGEAIFDEEIEDNVVSTLGATELITDFDITSGCGRNG